MNIYRKICTGISFAKGKPVLNIFCRDSNNNREVVNVFDLSCYFYVDENTQLEEQDVKESVISEQHGYTSLFGQKLKKIKVKKISDVRRLGKIYNGFESDLKWDKKALLDLKITDKFAYDQGKVYTLDHRFNALQQVESDTMTNDGVSMSVVYESNVDKLIIKKAIEEDEDLSKQKPKFGHTPFEVRTAILDIEVMADKREDLETRQGKIVCAVIWDSYTEQYFKFMNIGSERDLVVQILEKFRELDIDIISGWNINFDMNWIISKSIDYNLDLTTYFLGGKTWVSNYTDASGNFHEDIYLGGRILLDGLELYKKRTITTEKLNSYNLKYVAVVEGFDEWDDLGAKVKDLWDKDPDKIVEYCRIDVERTMQVLYKKKLLDGALTTCMFFGCGYDDVNTNSKVIESLSFLLKKNRILPNIVRGRDAPHVEGAVVLETTSGLHRNVGIYDAASLYPSIIAGLNISPECLVLDKDLTPNNLSKAVHVPIGERNYYLYRKSFRMGLMTEVITEMRKLRESIRHNRQKAVDSGDDASFDLYNDQEKVAKGVLASVYGVMGFKDFRLFNEDCANIITAVARGMINEIKTELSTDEHTVIYGDTDSVFVRTYGITSGYEAQKKINELMPKYLQKFGVEENVIEVNFEKIFKWILFLKKVAPKRKSKLWKKDTGTAKKTYIGFISHKESGPGVMKEVSELYYRGIALRRSDSAIVLKETMKRFFELMEDGSYKKSVEYLKEVYNSFHGVPLENLAMPRSVNEEDANNPWANGMRYSKEHLKFEFNSNEMPKLLYVKDQRKYPKTDVICYQEGHVIPPEFKIDYDVMFNKLIRAKFEPIVESLGIYWDTQIGKQGSLDNWLSN